MGERRECVHCGWNGRVEGIVGKDQLVDAGHLTNCGGDGAGKGIVLEVDPTDVWVGQEFCG